jgi:hypothetical protein
VPKSVRHRLIDAFKRNPRAFVGITKSHLIVHTLKILDKHGVVALVLPVITLALILSFLPNPLAWCLTVGCAGYLVFKVIRLFQHR